MKHKMICSAVLMAFGLAVSTAVAYPYETKSGTKKGEAGAAKPVEKAKAKGGCNKPCHKGAKTVADKAKAGSNKPCSGKCGKGCTKDCCKKGATLTAGKDDGGSNGRHMEALLASMPSMKYRIGDEVIHCSKSAEAMAGKSGKAIEYLVGEKAFADKAEAIAKLTALLETEVQTLQTMQFVAGGKCHFCPVTAKSVAKKTNTSLAYRVGGFDFAKKQDAEKALQLVHDAVGEVKIAYKVDGKTYGCSKTAGSKCKKTGKKMTYLVGKEETCCEKSAQLMLTEAKIRTIVETAAAEALTSTS